MSTAAPILLNEISTNCLNTLKAIGPSQFLKTPSLNTLLENIKSSTSMSNFYNTFYEKGFSQLEIDHLFQIPSLHLATIEIVGSCFFSAIHTTLNRKLTQNPLTGKNLNPLTHNAISLFFSTSALLAFNSIKGYDLNPQLLTNLAFRIGLMQMILPILPSSKSVAKSIFKAYVVFGRNCVPAY